MIIGLCGACGAGKDTVANILVNEHGFVKLSFAAALKDVVSIVFSWPREMLEGDTPSSRTWRETVDPFWTNKTGIVDFTPRRALQIVGTDLFRNRLYQETWIDIVENKITKILETHPDAHIVITDCRFVNEIALIQKFPGARIIQIVKSYNYNSVVYSDLIIQNDGTLEELKSAVDYHVKTL
jgi:hypothetical protein